MITGFLVVVVVTGGNMVVAVEALAAFPLLLSLGYMLH